MSPFRRKGIRSASGVLDAVNVDEEKAVPETVVETDSRRRPMLWQSKSSPRSNFYLPLILDKRDN